MHLISILLQNFRSYTQKTFEFDPNVTLIAGRNTAGKTNLVEAIYVLSYGKSFKAEKDVQMIRFGQEVGRAQGLLESVRGSEGTMGTNGTKRETIEKIKLEVMLAYGSVTGGRVTKKYLIDGASKRRVDFSGILPVVLFSPEELDIVVAGPSLRRRFLDDVLEQVDREYRYARNVYDKAIRQRNALLNIAKETGRRNKEQFSYWDALLITNGNLITDKRATFIDFINKTQKDIFDFYLLYDKSTISTERLLQYQDAEVASGVTLVGPHRDDFTIQMKTYGDMQDVRYFGSRGQQRLVVLQLKLFQIEYVADILHHRPLFVLDDIFSELDARNTQLVLDMVGKQQTIITTANKEILASKQLRDVSVIELEKL